jgi:hypothetical protein
MEKPNLLQIIPGKGFDKLLFGMKYSQMVQLLGDPSEIIKDDSSSNNEEYVDSMTVFYDEMGLAMFLEQLEGQDEMSLQSIEIDDPEATLFEKKIFQMKKNDIISLVETQTNEKLIKDTDEDLEEFDAYDLENNGMSLLFEDEELISVTIYNTK